MKTNLLRGALALLLIQLIAYPHGLIFKSCYVCCTACVSGCLLYCSP